MLQNIKTITLSLTSYIFHSICSLWATAEYVLFLPHYRERTILLFLSLRNSYAITVLHNILHCKKMVNNSSVKRTILNKTFYSFIIYDHLPLPFPFLWLWLMLHQEENMRTTWKQINLSWGIYYTGIQRLRRTDGGQNANEI